MKHAKRLTRSRIFMCLLLAAALPGPACAEPTPADAELKVDGLTRITCEYSGDPVRTPAGIIRSPKADYHYDLYLPPGYNDDPKAPFPILFIASASGNAKLGAMTDWLKRKRWAAAMLVESKNGPWDPVVGNFLAAHDDVIRRVRTVDGMKFMTGMSGAARASSLCTGLRPGFVGMFLQSAGFWGNYFSVQQNPRLAVFATFGRTDMNLSEAAGMGKGLPAKTSYRYVIFAGGHQWAPKEVAEEGLDWLEHWAYLGATATPAAKSLYLQFFGDLTNDVKNAKEPFARFEALDKAQTFAASHALSKEPSLVEPLTAMRKAATELGRDPAIKKEIAARDAFNRAGDSEQLARRKFASSAEQLKSMLEQSAKSYQLVADKSPATAYGEKAKAAVERLNNEPANPEPAAPKH